MQGGDQMIKITDMRSIMGDSAFLIDDGVTSVLVDTGFAFTGYNVANKIRDYLKDRKLKYILLTHSHYDHVLGSPYILTVYPEAQIVAGEYTKKIFEKPSARALMRELDRKAAATAQIYEYDDLIDNLKVDITVQDNDIINAGDITLRAIHLPGHTKCSFGFYLESEKMLISSETLGVYDGHKNIIPSYLVGYRLTLESIDKLKGLEIEKILIPHLGVLNTNDTQFYLENAKKSAVETCREVASILKFGGTKEQAFEYFKDRFYHGEVVNSYPIDAFTLNTKIMIDLIEREILS